MRGWPDVFRSDHRLSKKGSGVMERGGEHEMMEGKEGKEEDVGTMKVLLMVVNLIEDLGSGSGLKGLCGGLGRS